MLVIAVIVSLGKQFPGESFIDLLPKFLGKPIGTGIGLIYALLPLALILQEIKAVADAFHMYFLLRTPIWVLIICLLCSVLYIASKGFEGISRLAAFLFILPLTQSLPFKISKWTIIDRFFAWTA